MISKTLIYTPLSRKRVCRDLHSFSDIKCPLFTHLGWGVAERGQCHLFFTVFLILWLPLFSKMSQILSANLIDLTLLVTFYEDKRW